MELTFDGIRLNSPFYNETHKEWKDKVLRPFLNKEIIPNIDQWEKDGDIPLEYYKLAGEIGLFQLGYPEKFGGLSEGIDIFHTLITAEELARPGAGGFGAAFTVHSIALPPIINFGSEVMKEKIAPGVIKGTHHISLAITEPSGGSDVGNIKTTAKREGDHFVINGSKTFITGGLKANWFTAAVRTGGEGIQGVSLILIPSNAKGVSRTSVGPKQGWWCSDTATIYFENVKVPVDQIIGKENEGFKIIVNNFNNERIGMAAGAVGYALAAFEEAATWAKVRKTFGKSLSQHQVIQHKFAEMYRRINATAAYLEICAWNIQNGTSEAADISLLKVQATKMLEFVAREAMQIMGGISYVRECKTERIYREVRVMAIGGGSEEIMMDLAARRMGL